MIAHGPVAYRSNSALEIGRPQVKLASFDLEIAAVFSEDVEDWAQQPDLGISCAALASSDSEEVQVWAGVPRLDRSEAAEMVHALAEWVESGYTIVTWNGCAFDFRVLAEESGLLAESSSLAWRHVDLMLMVTFSKGHYLGLQKALEGAGLSGKLKSVRLSDGSILRDMDGSKAPHLWAQGEHEAVIAYLKQDVRQQLLLAQSVLDSGSIRWISRSGNLQVVPFSRLLTVEKCFQLPEPDTSWMTDPPRREQFVGWMA